VPVDEEPVEEAAEDRTDELLEDAGAEEVDPLGVKVDVGLGSGLGDGLGDGLGEGLGDGLGDGLGLLAGRLEVEEEPPDEVRKESSVPTIDAIEEVEAVAVTPASRLTIVASAV
jgi:hypothetical protein